MQVVNPSQKISVVTTRHLNNPVIAVVGEVLDKTLTEELQELVCALSFKYLGTRCGQVLH